MTDLGPFGGYAFIPTYTGHGSPLNVQPGKYGETYIDLDTDILWWNDTPGTVRHTTGWVSIQGGGGSGPQGAQGFQGSQGAQGAAGAAGAQGAQGTAGPQGQTGSQGAQGFQGTGGSPGPITITTQSGTTYTLALADAETEIEFTNSAAVTVTIPAHATVAFQVGTVINLRQMGTGQVQVAAAGGVTLLSALGSFTRVQNSTIGLVQDATDQWVLSGDTTT